MREGKFDKGNLTHFLSMSQDSAMQNNKNNTVAIFVDGDRYTFCIDDDRYYHGERYNIHSASTVIGTTMAKDEIHALYRR